MNPTPSPAPEAPELLPCPCGAVACINEIKEGYHKGNVMVYCGDLHCPTSCKTRWWPTRETAITAWNTRATAPAPASHEEWRKESYTKWLRAREKPHVPEGTKSTGITLPAPASGWIRTAALTIKDRCATGQEHEPSDEECIEILQRHAPDVAKLEAEVAELKRMLGGDNEGALLIRAIIYFAQ